ncbi:F-box associated domain, type 1 [Artemisia annua]|uniref:F-box associated domain, type 1 n=1 Tax=Artemisia annua TaxID=35608 RepID=A0A2U1LAP1_ARTAN|nr:F-box associated domain, type 1 [Artemisia annua]
MEDLPKDVMFNVLSRLQVKTIASCRCVCKEWRKLVSHSSFVKHHLSISPPHACLMVHQRSCSEIKKSRTLKLVEFFIDNVIGHHHSCINLELGINITPARSVVTENITVKNNIIKRSSNTEHITPVGSVNGLICLLVNDTKGEDRKVYICNPITNDYKIIPTRYSSDKIVRYGFGVSMADNVIGHHHSCINLELGINITPARSVVTENITVKNNIIKRSSNTEHITPVGSVNGLICLLVNDTKGEDRKVYICNPITNDYKIIPTRYSSDKIVRYGFGVSMAGEYKVIRILKRKHVKDLTEIEVYTLGTDQWRNLGQVPNYVSAIDGTRAELALNGRVHWLNHDIIYAFDLDKETVLQIPTPSGEEWKIFPFLGVLKGCLSLFARSQSNDRFSVWAMKEDGTEKSWHKTWNTNNDYGIYCLEFNIWDPKCLIDGINGTSKLIVLDSSNPRKRKLVAYCLETDRVEETAISHNGSVEIMTLMIYGPSFVKIPKHGVRASSYGSKVRYQHPRQIA